jgi:hypothetical protein
MENDETEETTIWKFKRITAHEGPLTPAHPSWKGSPYNIMIEWENREITSEPLAVIAADDPDTCALYAKENDLLVEGDAWKRFKPIAKRQQKLFRMVQPSQAPPFLSYRTKIPTSTASKFQKTTNTRYVSMRKLGARSGKTPPS